MQKIIALCIFSSYIHACQQFDLSGFPLVQSTINSSASEEQKTYIQQHVTNNNNNNVLPSTINQHTQNYVVLSIYIFIQAHKKKLCL